MLKYYKRYIGEDTEQEISYDKALETLLCTYRDTDVTHDMLTIPNLIQCNFSTIRVDDPDGVLKPMPGLWNLVPDGVKYDPDTLMRIR